MHPVLADSIDGGILMILLLGGGFATALLALLALYSASKGNHPLARMMIAPALVSGLVITIYFVYGLVTDPPDELDFSLSDLLVPWAIVAGPPLLAAGIAIRCNLAWKKKIQQG